MHRHETRVCLQGSETRCSFRRNILEAKSRPPGLWRRNRLFFTLCLYSPGDVWARETQSLRQLLIAGLFIFGGQCLRLQGLGLREPLAQRGLKGTPLLAGGTHDGNAKRASCASPARVGALRWSGPRRGATGPGRGRGVAFLRPGRRCVIFLLFPVFH